MVGGRRMPDFAGLSINVRDSGREEQRTACPQCSKGDFDDTLGVNVATGVFHCFRCGYAGKARDIESSVPAAIQRIDDPAVIERKRARLRCTIKDTIDLNDPTAEPVRTYLQSRGLSAIAYNPPRALRCHPALEYFDGTRSLGRFPAMIALYTGTDGCVVTLHATYLRPDGSGKACVPSPKKILGCPVRGATKGGAIRLNDDRSGVLGIAEGIENALSLQLMHNVPVWAAYCSGNLAGVRLPDDLREVYVAVDPDPAGEKAASNLAARVLRWRKPPEVFFVRPEGDGDLNDELMRRCA